MSMTNTMYPSWAVFTSSLREMGLLPKVTSGFWSNDISTPYAFTNLKVSASGSRGIYVENSVEQVLTRGSYTSRFKGIKTLRRLFERLNPSLEVYDSRLLKTYFVEIGLNGVLLLNKARVEVCPEKGFFKILYTVHASDCVPFNHRYILCIRDKPNHYSLFVATDEDWRRGIVRFSKKIQERYADEILDSEPSAFSEGDELFGDWVPQFYCKKGWSAGPRYALPNPDSNFTFKIA